MNFNTRFVWLICCSALVVAVGCSPKQPPADTRHVQYVVGISPYLDDESGEEVFRHIARFLLEDMPLNSSLWIYDAYNLRTVAQVNVPNKRAFESSRTRANQFSNPIQSLKGFLGEQNDQPDVAELNFDDAVRFPQFMDFVGENLMQTNSSTVAIVFGNPLYQDEKEVSFSMREDYFPSDGHLLASRERSVYGRSGDTKLLESVSVFFGYFKDPWASDLHRQKINRFWNLFLKSQGAKLATMSSDLPTIFSSLRGGKVATQRASSHEKIDESRTKIEMLRVSREVPITDWITRELPSNHQPPPPSTVKGPMKIGIRWRGDVDIDLYAKARLYSEVLFYDHTEVAEGYYFKDHRSSPDREYEFIEFTEPVDINEVRASVNFYEGMFRGGVEGEIRIEFEDRIYIGSFKLPAERGNKGRGGRDQREFWQEMDIPRILGLH